MKNPLTLLLAHDSKSIFVAIDRLIKVKGVKAIWLGCHVGSGGDNVIVGSFVRVNHDASSFEHFKIMRVRNPKCAFWTTIEMFRFQGFIPITILS